MYNEERKNWYLESNPFLYSPLTIDLIRAIFEKAEFEEKIFNKDLAEFKYLEAVDYLKSLNSRSPARLTSTCGYLSQYFIWCYNQGLVDSIDNPFDIRIMGKTIETIIPIDDLNDKFFDKETILEYLDCIPDETNKFILYAPYLGIKGYLNEDIINLRIEDIDINQKTAQLKSGLVMEIDDLFIDLATKAHLSTRYRPDGIEMDDRFKKYDYIQTGFIIKPCNSGKVSVNSTATGLILNSRIKIIKGQTKNNFLTLNTLLKNGLYNYIKTQYEKRGISLKEAIMSRTGHYRYDYDEETQEYIYKFGLKMTVRMLRMEIKDYIDRL